MVISDVSGRHPRLPPGCSPADIENAHQGGDPMDIRDVDDPIEFRLPGTAAQAIQIDQKFGPAVPGYTYTYEARRCGRGRTYLVKATEDAAENILKRCRERAFGSGWDQPSSWARGCRTAVDRIEGALED